MFSEGHITFMLSGTGEARLETSWRTTKHSWLEIWAGSLSLCSSETFLSLLHLKTGSAPSFFGLVSQQHESSIKRLINLEARRQSCPRSRSSAWDREEIERQREEKLKGKWSELEWKTQEVFLNGQSLKTLCAQFVFFSPLCCIYPQRESSIPFRWICCDGWFEVRHFSSFSMTYWLQQCSISNQVTNGFSLWMTMWGLARPRTVTFKCTFKSNILQVHSKWHLLEPQCATDARFLFEPFWMFVHLFMKETQWFAFSS